MEVRKTERVQARELKIGDTIIVAVCPSIDAGGEPYGGTSITLQTIVGIAPHGEYGGLEFQTRWETAYSSGTDVHRYHGSEFVTKL